MPKYKKRDPEYTAIQFTGSNIREVMDELGTEFSTIYKLDIKGATGFVLKDRDGLEGEVGRGHWIVVDRQENDWWTEHPHEFNRKFEPVKRVGRPPKEKK